MFECDLILEETKLSDIVGNDCLESYGYLKKNKTLRRMLMRTV